MCQFSYSCLTAESSFQLAFSRRILSYIYWCILDLRCHINSLSPHTFEPLLVNFCQYMNHLRRCRSLGWRGTRLWH